MQKKTTDSHLSEETKNRENQVYKKAIQTKRRTDPKYDLRPRRSPKNTACPHSQKAGNLQKPPQEQQNVPQKVVLVALFHFIKIPPLLQESNRAARSERRRTVQQLRENEILSACCICAASKRSRKVRRSPHPETSAQAGKFPVFDGRLSGSQRACLQKRPGRTVRLQYRSTANKPSIAYRHLPFPNILPSCGNVVNFFVFWKIPCIHGKTWYTIKKSSNI